MGKRASASCGRSGGGGLQVSDRLRIRRGRGRASSTAPDRDFFKLGYEVRSRGSVEGAFGRDVEGGFDGISMTAVESLVCDRQEPYKAVRSCILPR